MDVPWLLEHGEKQWVARTDVPSAQASLAGRRAVMRVGRRVLPKRAVGFWHAMWRCQNAKTDQKYHKNMQLIQLIVMILVIFPSI